MGNCYHKLTEYRFRLTDSKEASALQNQLTDEYKHALVRSELRSALGGSSYYAIIVEEYPELNQEINL